MFCVCKTISHHLWLRCQDPHLIYSSASNLPVGCITAWLQERYLWSIWCHWEICSPFPAFYPQLNLFRTISYLGKKCHKTELTPGPVSSSRGRGIMGTKQDMEQKLKSHILIWTWTNNQQFCWWLKWLDKQNHCSYFHWIKIGWIVLNKWYMVNIQIC